MNVAFSRRLAAIADEVITHKPAADIGTDHGYLPAYLVKNKSMNKVIATDVNVDPLNKAKRVIARYHLHDEVELRLGNGLEVLKEGEVATVIVAGMGGVLISKLMESNISIAQGTERFILQPVQSVPELRHYLLTNGYDITKEILVMEDRRFYEIIVTRYTGCMPFPIDPLTLEIGSFIKQQDRMTAQAYLKRKMRLSEKKLRGLLEAEKKNDSAISETAALIWQLNESLESLNRDF